MDNRHVCVDGGSRRLQGPSHPLKQMSARASAGPEAPGAQPDTGYDVWDSRRTSGLFLFSDVLTPRGDIL